MTSVILLGQAPSRTGRAPLDGRCGARLAELAGLPGYDELGLYFALGNLLPAWPGKAGKGDGFDLPRARALAAGFLEECAGEFDLVVMLGRNVAAAFGAARAPFLERFRVGPTAGVVFPHPSGVSRWWNEPANAARARRFMRRLAR